MSKLPGIGESVEQALRRPAAAAGLAANIVAAAITAQQESVSYEQARNEAIQQILHRVGGLALETAELLRTNRRATNRSLIIGSPPEPVQRGSRLGRLWSGTQGPARPTVPVWIARLETYQSRTRERVVSGDSVVDVVESTTGVALDSDGKLHPFRSANRVRGQASDLSVLTQGAAVPLDLHLYTDRRLGPTDIIFPNELLPIGVAPDEQPTVIAWHGLLTQMAAGLLRPRS